MIAKLDQEAIGVPDAVMSPKAELAALNAWLSQPLFVARLLRRLLADDPNLESMATQILKAVQERDREGETKSRRYRRSRLVLMQ
jgi:hypothetical protein